MSRIREFKKMGEVRPQLMRVVYSNLTDEEAAAQIGEEVRSNPRAAKATLDYVRRIHDASHGYETDRACRILVGAIEGTPPEAVRPEDAKLFERERELGWLPLAEAFERLAAAVPELEAIRVRSEELAASPELFGIEQEADGDGLVIPAGVLPKTDGLVGPVSGHPDPLIRSRLASSIVANYVRALLTHTGDRALWDHNQPRPRVRVTGSFF